MGDRDSKIEASPAVVQDVCLQEAGPDAEDPGCELGAQVCDAGVPHSYVTLHQMHIMSSLQILSRGRETEPVRESSHLLTHNGQG